jgi:preprotein translocase subunit SecD
VASPTPTPRPGRAIAVLVVLIVALFGWMAVSGVRSPKLGIDLAGGTSLTLKPVLPPGDTGEITDDAVDQAVNILRQRVDGTGVAESSITKQGNGANSVIVIEVPGQNDKDLYNKVGRTAKMSFRKVLLSGAPTPATAASPSPSATTSPSPKSTTSPTAKPKATSTPKPTTTPSGNGRSTSGLHAASPTPSPTPSPSSTGSSSTATAGAGTISAADQAAFDALDCTKKATTNPADVPTKNIVTCSTNGQEKYILGPQEIPGSDISGAAAALQSGANGTGLGQWVVNLSFNGEGASKFTDVTRDLYANLGAGATSGVYPDANRFAIVLDGLVESAPGTTSVINGGQATISGSFTQQSATDLANVLNYGALPLAFDRQEQQSISATLGSDQLYAGVIAGAIGLLLVVIYSLLYYRGLGLVTVASLAVAASLTYGCLVLLGHTLGYTLTLAGIAGAIVSIGITADSFVVLFERIRDEMREGRTFRVAVEAGWKRARRTILAADAVSFIAAVTLYLLAVGGVQGFAFTLGLTTIIDVAVVFLFTKPLLTMLARTRFFGEGHPLSGVSPERLGRTRPTKATRPAPTTARTAGEA